MSIGRFSTNNFWEQLWDLGYYMAIKQGSLPEQKNPVQDSMCISFPLNMFHSIYLHLYANMNMEKPEKYSTQEERMMEALSRGIYGRTLQNRCSILNRSQREMLEATMRAVIPSSETEPENLEKEKE